MHFPAASYMLIMKGVIEMDKIDLAYKLTADIIKKYDLPSLEEKYNTFGGNLTAVIFNEIYSTVTIENSSNEPVVIYDDLSDPD